MKILVIALLGITLTGNLSKTYSWDSTAAKYYPLAVGNKWYYQLNIFSHFNCVTLETYNEKRTVVSHELMPNGKWYFKIIDSRTGIFYERIDSASMDVYFYVSGNECKRDSLNAKINDIFRINCYGAPYVITDTSRINFAGVQLKTLKANRVSGIFYHRLVYGIGLHYEINCQPDGFDRTLRGCVIDGEVFGDTNFVVGVNIISIEVPERFSLSQNYPNPFNPSTKIKFSIPANQSTQRVVSTSMIIYDALGREVQTLVNQDLYPGTYEANFDGSNLPSGVYYYKFDTKSYTETKKMLLIK